MTLPSDILEMSDEDFAKLSGPPVEAPASTEAAPAAEPAPVVEEPVVPQTTEPAPVVEETADPLVTAPAVETPVVVEGEQQPAAATPPAEAAPATTEEFDYKAAYEGLIAKPLRANGKDIKLNSVDELVQLAQQGANYTRKMQDLAPHRRTLMMLESNGLLDPAKLDLMVSLSKRDPAAIQKFFKDSGINPLDIDTEAEPTYQGGNHQVSDEEVAFTTALEDLQQSDSGKHVLQSIHGTWDQASKELLATQPNIMDIMRVQHEEGFYDRIAAEVDRQKMLGAVPAGQTWLQSYKLIGDKMVAAGAFADLLANQEPAAQTPPAAAAPVAVRVAAPAPTVANDAKANAAAASRATPSAAKVIVNPLEMSDEDFLKHFAKRL